MIWKSADKTPQRVGDYDLLEKIAEGGMSSIYKGRHRATGAAVAVKIVKEQLAANPIYRKRFEQEFRAARNLDHPHIVRGLDFGEDNASVYLVMELVEGESLGERIQRQGRLPEKEAVDVIVQVAEGLHQAHQQGILHRDVKPDNILITPDGRAKLTDLGLAKDVEADLDLTRPSTGLGTPHFMAPEQFDDAKNADARCDVYSLGATLYMAVTGVLPFDARGGYLKILGKKISNQLTPPRREVPSLSERVDAAIRRAMSFHPEQRPASCAEFIEDLTGRSARQSPLEGTGRPDAILQPDGLKPTGSERRVAVRFASDLEILSRPIGGEKEVNWSGKIHNVSATGIALLVERRFEPGTILSIEVPGEESRLAPTLLARVVRVRAESPGMWLLGCAFGPTLADEEIHSLL